MEKWYRVKEIQGEHGETKVIILGRDLHTLQTSGKYPRMKERCQKELNLL